MSLLISHLLLSHAVNSECLITSLLHDELISQNVTLSHDLDMLNTVSAVRNEHKGAGDTLCKIPTDERKEMRKLTFN